MKKMRHCPICSAYTLREMHCDSRTESAHPKRFNPNDRYGEYRREWKGVD